MLDILIIIIKGSMLGWLISRFHPLQMLIESIPNKKHFLHWINLIISCSKCCAFWGSLIIFHNIWYAIASSFICLIYEKFLSDWENKIKF